MPENKPQKKNKPHLSPTQINQFLKCEAQWFFRYIQNLKIPPNGALTLGSSYDAAMTTNYLQKIESGIDMKTEDVVDAFVTAFNKNGKETEWHENENPAKMKDKGTLAIKEYQKKISPTIMPVSAQKDYIIQFPNVDWQMICKVDLETQDGYIVDNKTTSRTPSRSAVTGEYKVKDDYRFQMLCYSIASKMKNGIKSGDKLRLDYAIMTKSPKIIQVEVPPPNQDDLMWFKKITAMTFQRQEKIRNGEIEPMPNRNSNLCSRKWCGFWSECVKKYGGNVE